MAQPVVMAIFAPSAGRISDRTNPGNIAAVGMTLTMAGLFLLSRLNAVSSLFYIIVCLIFVGFGFAFFSSPNSNAVMSAVDKNYYGVASGIISTMRQAGQMIGLAIATMMISIFIGKAVVARENQARFLDALRMAFLVSSVLCFFGIFASLARKKTAK
jgi:MFS family permease